MLRTYLRHLRIGRGQLATVVVMVLVLSAVAAVVPLLLDRRSDDGIRYAVGSATVAERSIVMSQGGRIEGGSSNDVFAPVVAAGAKFWQGLPSSVRSLSDHSQFVIDAVRYILTGPAGDGATRTVTLRYQQQVGDHIRLVTGRLPARTKDTVEVAGTADARPTSVPVVEIALSQRTAAALEMRLGQTVPAIGDFADDLNPPYSGRPPGGIAFRLTGIFSIDDPSDDYWFGDPRFDPPPVEEDPTSKRVLAAALFAPAAYDDILEDITPASLRYTHRYFVEPGSLDAGDLDPLTTDLHRLGAQYPSITSGSSGDPSLSTGLPAILAQYAEQRAAMLSILSLGLAGLLVIGLAVVGMVAALVADRRREEIRLLRGRGAATSQLVTAQLLEGMLYCVPAGLLGYLSATVLVPSRPSAAARWGAVIVVAATVLLLAGAVGRLARQRLGPQDRPDPARVGTSVRRTALEVFVVVLAVLGVVLLRRRGLTDQSTGAGEVDPYLAAVPVLVGLAVALVAVRAYRWPLRALAARTSRRRDLVAFLGLRRSQRSSMTRVPLVVLLLAVAISAFASVLMHSIGVGQVDASWRAVGADYRVTSVTNGPLPPQFSLDRVAGVEASAAVDVMPDVLIATDRPAAGTIDVVALDTAAYQRVAGGTPVDPHFSAAVLGEPTGPGTGTADQPIPVIVSSRWPPPGTPAVGDVFTIGLGDTAVHLVVDEVRDDFQGVDPDDSFVVVSLSSLRAAVRHQQLLPTAMYVRAPADTEPALAAAIDEQHAIADLQSRAAAFARVHDAPLIVGAAQGFQVGMVLAALLSALAAVVAVALDGRARARDLGLLRTLGLSRRQAHRLVITEQAPALVAGLVGGAALGLLLAWLVRPGLALNTFTGSSVPVPLVVDWATIAYVTVIIGACVAVAVGVAGRLALRADVTTVLRIGAA